MADMEMVIEGLEKAKGFFEARADMAVGEGKMLLLSWANAQSEAIELLKAQGKKWIPFVKRPLTEEEQKNHPGWCYILDGEVPDDEQEILLYRPWKNKEGYIIEMDRYINNGDTVYLEGAMDIENGMFWMPLPEPPKEGIC